MQYAVLLKAIHATKIFLMCVCVGGEGGGDIVIIVTTFL